MAVMAFVITAWRSGLRGRSCQAVLFLGLLLLGVAWLASSFSPRQPQAIALDVGLSCLRFTLLLAVLFWVQELVGKEIERKTVLFVLSYPMPRWQFLLGRYVGVTSLAAMTLAILGLGLAGIAYLAGSSYHQQLPLEMGLPYCTALFYLWLDVCVVAAFTVLVASVSTTPMLSFSLGAAFAVASHALGPVLRYLRLGADGDGSMVTHYLPVLSVSEWLIPDLGRLDLRAWPLYGQAPALDYLLMGAVLAVGFIALALMLAMAVFSRREFN